jgi:hypothetical protein
MNILDIIGVQILVSDYNGWEAYDNVLSCDNMHIVESEQCGLPTKTVFIMQVLELIPQFQSPTGLFYLQSLHGEEGSMGIEHTAHGAFNNIVAINGRQAVWKAPEAGAAGAWVH